MRGLLLLLFSFLVRYTMTAMLTLARIPRGQRREFINSHAFEVSMQALLSVFTSVWITILVGIPIDLLIVWFFAVPLGSPLKYKILAVLFVIIYFCVFFRILSSELPAFTRPRR